MKAHYGRRVLFGLIVLVVNLVAFAVTGLPLSMFAAGVAADFTFDYALNWWAA